MEQVVFHIIGADDWSEAEALGRYAPDSLAVEGFIHLSQRQQVLHPANNFYRGRTDLKLLVIDASKLRAEVVYEPGSHGESDLFPHLYGQLNLDAVTTTIDFPCRADGGFDLPPALGGV